MKPQRNRVRRMMKWAGLGACFLSVVLLASSLLFTVTMYRSGWATVLGFGCVTFQATDAKMGNPQQGWAFAKRQAMEPLIRFWWIKILHPVPNVWAVIIPLWIPFVLLAIPTYILWRRDRKHPEGHCQGCGYDLKGNVSGVCSECGTKVEQA